MLRTSSTSERPLLRSLLALLMPLLVLGLMLLLLTSLGDVRQSSSTEGQKLLEDSLHRAIVTCYVTEGRYPPTLDHVRQRYGVQVDKERYFVDYQVFADNIMPDVTVIAVAGE